MLPSNLLPKHNGEEHTQHLESARLGNAARTTLKQPGRCGALSTMAMHARSESCTRRAKTAPRFFSLAK